MVHNRYVLHGGEDISCALDADMARMGGCTVDLYEEDNDRVEKLGRLRTGLRSIWSAETYRNIRARLRAQRYALVHVQNFFPLISPSVYYAALAEGVPVVQSLRNYRLLCPAGNFVRNGKFCDDCLGRAVAWPGAVHACYRDSVAASATVVAMLAVHHRIGTWRRRVDAFIALSRFGRDQLVAAGLPAQKIHIKPNSVRPDPGVGRGDGGYAIFVGRLDIQKGVETLVKAWKLSGFRMPLKIIGDGPLAPMVRNAAEESPAITWLGQRSLDETYSLMRGALFLVFTSIGSEGFPRVLPEAFACGTPVIASKIAPMEELIEDGRNGALFEPGDALELSERILWAAGHPEQLGQMRRHARQKYEAEFTPEQNCRILMSIYDSVVPRRIG